MSNRCSIFATNFVPGTDTMDLRSRQCVLLSEHQFDVPLTFRLLACSNPQVCQSLEWPDEGNVAICADLAGGRQRLEAVFSQLAVPATYPTIKQMFDVLDLLDPSLAFILLEPFDIFQMYASQFDEEISQLVKDLNAIAHQVPTDFQEFKQALKRSIPSAFERRWLGLLMKYRRPTSTDAILRSMGLGDWFNTPVSPTE